jgi:glycosyltransferase involved in cell wall biosynthesis
MVARVEERTGVSPLSEKSGRPIRVARVIARLNIGGPAQHTILLTAGLDRTRFETTLVTGVVGQAEGDFTNAARTRGVNPIVIPELGRSIRPARDLIALVKLVRLFRQFRPDIVHTHTAKAGTLGRLAARVAGVPVTIHTFHGHVLDGYFPPAVTRAFVGMERTLARMTDRLVTVSPRLKTQLLAMGIGRPDQVEVIPLGLDLERFRRCRPEVPTLGPSLGLAPGTPLLGIVGRLVPIKDHATLFQALALLPPSDAPAHLAVIGDGEERARLESLAGRLGLAPRIHFLGWRIDLESILNELDVVICASKNEGTPVALIEAMAAGVPVLSTDVGGVADLVAHAETGWLVPPGDPPAMAGGIRHLLDDRALRTRLAATGGAMVLDAYDVARLIPRMEALYTGVINEKLTTDKAKPVKEAHG